MLLLGRRIGESVYILQPDKPLLKLNLISYSLVNNFAQISWEYYHHHSKNDSITPDRFLIIPGKTNPIFGLSVKFSPEREVPVKLVLDIPKKEIIAYREEYLERLMPYLIDNFRRDRLHPISKGDLRKLENKIRDYEATRR